MKFIKWCQKILHKMYDMTLELANKTYAMFALAGVAFTESIVFPIPPDLLVIAISLSNRKKAFLSAIIATIFSVLGGIAAYFIGMYLFDSVGKAIIEWLNYEKIFNQFNALYNKYGFWIVFGAGLTPFPYKVITVASGVVSMNLPVFILGSFMSRASRFFLISTLIYIYGEKAKVFIEKHLGTLSIISFLLLVGMYFLIVMI